MSVRRTLSPVVCWSCLLVLSAIPAGRCLAGDAPAGSPSADSVRVALNDVARGLESPTFAVRQAASGQLITAQAPAVPLMLSVAKEGNLEAAVRAVGILEAIYISAEAKGDAAAIDGAEFALDELIRSGRPSVADRADIVLESHYEIRERRAVTEIERFHGVPNFGPPGDLVAAWNQRFNPAPAPADRNGEASKDKMELTSLTIGPKWTGGDEGLKQVARLKRLRLMYRIQGCPVSDDAVTRLRAAIPGLEVQVRGAAKLGIRAGGVGQEKGCVIDTVQEGEAAANAGLKSQDRIVRFGNHDVDDFYSLVDLLRNYKPGDVVESLIYRDEEKMTVPITLTGWD